MQVGFWDCISTVIAQKTWLYTPFGEYATLLD